MDLFLSGVIGYLLGCLSPAALIGKIKKINLKQVGTKNLGATNVSLSVGAFFGVAVMLIDIAKSFSAYKLCAWVFPNTAAAGLLSAFFAVLGHIFPFYLKFNGGKGLAPFGGMVLAHSPENFIILLILCLALMFAVNYSFIFPFTAGLLFPVFSGLEGDILVLAICVFAGGVLIYKHFGNFLKAIKGDDSTIISYFTSKTE